MRSEIIETEEVRNVYQPEDESIIRHGGGITIGQHREDRDQFSIHLCNALLGMRAFIIVDREEIVSLRDALNRELAS